MEGYDHTTYGEAFADVYDDWYRDVSDIEATVTSLLELAAGGTVLELGVGTGRIAVPLAEAGRAAGIRVIGIDSSAAMLNKMAQRDPDGLVEAHLGDMTSGLPDGPFSIAFAAYNTLFNLTADGAQDRCFQAVADRLTPDGRFVVEAFVPDEPPRRGDHLSVRSLTADRIVLSVSVHTPDRQLAEGQFVEFSESEGVRLRPWSIRYSTPHQLDAMASRAGFILQDRWETFGREPYDDGSQCHVSIYLKR